MTACIKFADWEFKMTHFLSAGDCEHSGEILEWITQEQEDAAENTFDMLALQRVGWTSTRWNEVLVHCVVSNRTVRTPHRLARNG